MKACILLLLTLFFTSSVDAQLMRQLKNAAEKGVSRAVEKRVEAEAEKIAQKQLEKAFGEMYGSDVPRGFDMSKILKGLGEDVEIADAYAFTGHQVMEITGQDEKGKSNEPLQMKIFFPEEAHIMGFEATPEGKNKKDGSFFMIYDFFKNASIILMDTDGKKNRMAYGIDLMGIATDTIESEDTSDPSTYMISKTGKTKTIFGHTCEEYLLDNEEGTAHYWISSDKISSNQTFFGNGNPFLQARLQSSPSSFENLPKGNLFEMEFISKTDKSNLKMTTIALENDQATRFLMADYPSLFESID
ncbi:DUF4412 domain-containing protein [Mongoliitalea daihaiensis]|uniref:DUF4412 domain-containing protein n=1 Tax=Mongoliitalea daihaiensis TaxID=2782006 RepID=UPI001F3EEB5D|nr:DUF4412 domain-containing protein [Mongoliitalea daihaiensis]UJP63732.1 DUF4412 domain-containing protein [Mongoliitalea daihaiensis]